MKLARSQTVRRRLGSVTLTGQRLGLGLGTSLFPVGAMEIKAEITWGGIRWRESSSTLCLGTWPYVWLTHYPYTSSYGYAPHVTCHTCYLICRCWLEVQAPHNSTPLLGVLGKRGFPLGVDFCWVGVERSSIETTPADWWRHGVDGWVGKERTTHCLCRYQPLCTRTWNKCPYCGICACAVTGYIDRCVWHHLLPCACNIMRGSFNHRVNPHVAMGCSPDQLCYQSISAVPLVRSTPWACL